MTNNQVTEQVLTPDEVREIVAYLAAHRERAERLDIAVNVVTPSDPKQAAAIAKPYFEAGATWCAEYDTFRLFDEYRKPTRSDPPKA